MTGCLSKAENNALQS